MSHEKYIPTTWRVSPDVNQNHIAVARSALCVAQTLTYLSWMDKLLTPFALHLHFGDKQLGNRVGSKLQYSRGNSMASVRAIAGNTGTIVATGITLHGATTGCSCLFQAISQAL